MIAAGSVAAGASRLEKCNDERNAGSDERRGQGVSDDLRRTWERASEVSPRVQGVKRPPAPRALRAGRLSQLGVAILAEHACPHFVPDDGPVAGRVEAGCVIGGIATGGKGIRPLVNAPSTVQPSVARLKS